MRYEYLDHTADIQIHGWGATLAAAFEEVVIGMFGYMTELKDVRIERSLELSVTGHDMQSLLFKFMDEFLFHFHTETNLVCKDVRVTALDLEKFSITAEGFGETFDLSKHEQGTEIKAITYSAMKIITRTEEECADGLHPAEIYVIVDI